MLPTTVAESQEDHDIVVTVRNLNGNVIFGPQALPYFTSCAKLVDVVVDPVKPQAAKLMRGMVELSRHEPIGDYVDDGILELEVNAVIFPLKLTKPERQDHLATLQSLVTGRRRRALPADALLELPEAARADRNIVQEAVRMNGCALEYAHSSLKADRALVSEAVASRSMALVHAHPKFLSDRRLVRKALNVGGAHDQAGLFEHLGNAFRADREIAIVACCKDLANVKYIDATLRADLSFWFGLLPCLQAHHKWPNDLIVLLEHRDFALRAIGINAYALRKVSAALQQDKTVVLQAVSSDGNILVFANEDMKNDIDVCSAAVGSKGQALRFVGKDMRNNIDLCSMAVKADRRAKEFVPKYLRDQLFFG